MKVPFVSFIPMEAELKDDFRKGFDRVFSRSWYIDGVEDKEFERSIGKMVDIKLYKAIDKNKDFTGILKGYDSDSITININEKDEKFLKNDIAKVNLTVNFG